MEDHLKILEDNRDENIKIADPVEVWADIHIAQIRADGKQGVIRLPSKKLHEKYIEWAEQLNEPSYLYNQIQFMKRFSNLKIDGVKTGIHTKTCKCCSFDMDVINKISI